MRRFADRFAQAGFDASSLYPCYGLAESTLLAAGSDHAQPPTIETFDRAALAEHRAVVVSSAVPAGHVQELVGSGRSMPDHKLLIVSCDEELVDPSAAAQVVAENQVGEIVLQGPSIAQGYWRREEATSESFGQQVEGHEGRFLRTGDLGFLRQGELFVTGRRKDVIIVRGRNHYPQDIEQTLEQCHEALMPGAAFSVTVDGNEELVVVHQIDRQYRNRSCESILRSMRLAVRSNHDLDPYAIILIRQTSLPLTSSGKVQRSLCREQYLQDELKIVDQWVRPTEASRPVQHHDEVGATATRVVKLDREGVAIGDNHDAKQVEPPRPARQSVSGMSVDRAAERIEAWMMNWLIDRAGLDSKELDRNRPFAELGVDSMTAVELSQELEEEFGVALNPVVAWNYPTPSTLASYLAGEAITRQQQAISEDAQFIRRDMAAIQNPPHATPIAVPPTANQDPLLNGADDVDLESLLAEIEGLSDEQAAQLLSRDAGSS